MIQATIEEQILFMFDWTHLSYDGIAEHIECSTSLVQRTCKNNRSHIAIRNRQATVLKNKPKKRKLPHQDYNPSKDYPNASLDKKGYYTVPKPNWWSDEIKHKRIYLHHKVFCEACGLDRVPKGFVIHHVDCNKANNDLENLALLTDRAHQRLHSLADWMEEGAETS